MKTNIEKHVKASAKGNGAIPNVISTNQHFELTFLMQIFKFQRRTPVVARLFSFPAPSVRAHPKSLLKYGPQREKERERWRREGEGNQQ